MQPIYRRFQIINPEKQQALEALLDEKQITYEDLALILAMIKFREGVMSADGQLILHP